jgi:uncharacterized protein (TIGR00645 family)
MRWLERVEDILENRVIFAARWLLTPAYVVLVLSLAVLAIKSLEEFVELLTHLHLYDDAGAITQVLVIVDLVLVMNLVLMVLFVGYINFVSVIHPKKREDWPSWMGKLDYSGLKIYVMGTIVAISAIKLLRAFIELSAEGKLDSQRLTWMTIIHMAFVFSILILALSNKLSTKATSSSFDRLAPGADLEAKHGASSPPI